MNFVLGLAGGSGSGKSTLAFGLQDAFPERITVFHLDDYFRPQAEVPKLAEMTNWDSPEALRHDQMAKDLRALKEGQAVTINTKSPRLNPGYEQTKHRIPVSFQPRPLIVVEGFLTLHYPELRKLIDLAVYLDAPFELHSERRVHGDIENFPPDYNELVLKPMHQRYVEPSKRFADVVIDVEILNRKQVLARVMPLLKQYVELDAERIS